LDFDGLLGRQSSYRAADLGGMDGGQYAEGDEP